MSDDTVSLEGLSESEVRNLAALSLKFASNPETRKQYFGMAKKIDPSFSAPELEIDSVASTLRTEMGGQIKELQDKLAEKELREKYNGFRMEPVKSGLIAESELPDLEKYMKDKGFLPNQYQQAAEHRHMERSLAAPTPQKLRVWGENDDPERRKNPAAWFKKNATQAVNEMRLKKAIA